jgi:hypothetical protein
MVWRGGSSRRMWSIVTPTRAEVTSAPKYMKCDAVNWPFALAQQGLGERQAAEVTT